MASMRDFIEQYLKNERIADYAGWVSAYGKDTGAAYAKDVAAADNAYAAARSGYGTRASSLLASGLTGSGYGDYLDRMAYAEREKARLSANERREAGEKENRQGYAAYLEKRASEAESAANEASDDATLLGKLLGQKITDKRAAVTYLSTLGADEEQATRLAESAVQIQRGTSDAKKSLIRECISEFYRYSTAYEYARAHGMSDEAAAEIATVVQAYRDAFYEKSNYVFDEEKYPVYQ